MTAFATARAWTVGTALITALSAAQAQPYPVTSAQRAAAQQVAQQGVPEGELSPDAPDSYTVKRGDTLWGISGMYLRRPWRWPDLWGMNLQAISNPHLIYPGQVLYLERRDGYARLGTARSVDRTSGEPEVVRISPSTRSESLADTALPTLQPHLIEPFLAEPLIVDADTLQRAPRIIATTDQRVLMASGDRAYVRGTAEAPLRKGEGLPRHFRLFRDAVALKDPVTGEILGYEAKYLGNADLVEGETTLEITDSSGKTRSQGVPATVELSKAKNEMRAGDRLLPAPPRGFINYTPHAPAGAVQAHVVSLYGESSVRWAAVNHVIAINKGQRDGINEGTVLEVVSRGLNIVDKTADTKEMVQLPAERNGYAMVFRTFERVSYALILSARRGVEVGDLLSAPAP